MCLSHILRLIVLVLIVSVSPAFAATGTWTSAVTGGPIAYTTHEASVPLKDVAGNYLTVVYLENTGFQKVGQNSNQTDVNWLLSQGYRVIEIDYVHDSRAVSPGINADINAINKAINNGTFCGLNNCSKYRSWVLFEGYRIARDVAYFKDDPTVYNYSTSYTEGDSLYMDIIYPANSPVAVPVVLSFSYSNSYFGGANIHQRLNLGNTLAGFGDSFLEGSPANGIAWAIADHPKYCPWGNGKPVGATDNKTYQSYQTNPDAAQKVKSAIRTLRVLGNNLGLSGKIGIYGFSRGSDAGSIAVGDRVVAEFENAGLHQAVSDDVQVAALGSGVFDFTFIYNTTGDGDSNLETKCPLAWGPLSANYAAWQLQGSYHLAQTTVSAPVIFFYNTDDAQYYQHQIRHFKARLDTIGVRAEVMTNYGTGHSVPQTPAALSRLYDFFNTYLTPPMVVTSIAPVIGHFANMNLSVDYKNGMLNLYFNQQKAGETRIILYNVAGVALSCTESAGMEGRQTRSIALDKILPANGVYLVEVSTPGERSVKKFLK